MARKKPDTITIAAVGLGAYYLAERGYLGEQGRALAQQIGAAFKGALPASSEQPATTSPTNPSPSQPGPPVPPGGPVGWPPDSATFQGGNGGALPNWEPPPEWRWPADWRQQWDRIRGDRWHGWKPPANFNPPAGWEPPASWDWPPDWRQRAGLA